jgi:hypothetical protein
MIASMKIAGRLFLALLLPVSALSAADDYVIRFTRPSKIGDRFRLDAKGTTRESERITVGGQVQTDDKDLSVHLVAAATVLAVDSQSNATRIEYVIQTCEKTEGGKTEQVLAAGRKVIAESDAQGKTEFMVDGDPALDDISKALGVVISAHTPGSPTDDDIFGTTERKKVGDTWGINTRTAATYLSKAGLGVSADNLKGTVSLDAVKMVGGVKALSLTTHMSAEGMTMELPEFLQIEKSSMAGEFTSLVPVDPEAENLLPNKIKMTINVLLRGQKPDTGSSVTIEEKMEMSVENTYSALGKGVLSASRR